MQVIQQKSLGYNLNVPVPESVEEFDRLAKEQGAALREANKNVIYRSFNAEWRNTFLHGADAEKNGDTVVREAIQGLEQLTGIERKTKVVKPEKRDAADPTKIVQEEVTGWDETEDEYESRVMAALVQRGDFKSTEEAKASYAAHAQKVADLIPFDPSKTERKSAGPKKTPNTYVEVAKAIVEATGSVENAITAFQRKTGQTVNPATLDGLAAAVWADQKAQKAKIANSYAAA